MKRLAILLASASLAITGVSPVRAETEQEAEQGMTRPSFLPPDIMIVEALDASPIVNEAEANLRGARAQSRQLAAGEHETVVSVTLDDRDVRGDGRFTEWSMQLTRGLRLPGKADLDRAAGVAGVRAASDGVEDARHQASLTFAEYWVVWLAAVERRTIDEIELATYAQDVKALSRRIELKDAAPVDLDRAVAAQARAAAALAVSERDELNARAMFDGSFPGLRPVTPAQLTSPTEPSRPYDLWADLIVERSHELTMARALADQQHLLARRVSRDRAPDPSVGVRVFNERGGAETGVGLTLSVPFSGARRSATADRQTAAASAAEARFALIAREVRSNADRDVISSAAAFRAWLDSDAARAAAEQSARRITRGYELGELGLTDRLMAERQVFEMRRLELEARARAHLALLKMALDAHEFWLSEE